MGVSYLLFTLNDEIAPWLRENNVSLPSPLPQSRFPSLCELKAIVEHLDGYSATVRSCSVTNSVDIDVVDQRGYRAGWSTTIWANKLNDKTRLPEEGDAVRLSFHKGHPELAVLIAEKLAHVCGPLVIVDQGLNCKPLVVTEGVDPRQVVDEWFKH